MQAVVERLAVFRVLDHRLADVLDVYKRQVVYYLAHYLTDRVDTLISGIADQLDAVEELVEADERASPDQHQLRTLRRRSAGLRRYLAPQRDIYSQLARYKLSWFVEDDADYWNELNNRLTRNLEELELIRERISVLQEACLLYTSRCV